MKQFLASSSKAYKKAQARLKHLEEVPAPFMQQAVDPSAGTATTAVVGVNLSRLRSNAAASSDEDEDDADADAYADESDVSELSSEEDLEADDWVKELEALEKEAEAVQVSFNY